MKIPNRIFIDIHGLKSYFWHPESTSESDISYTRSDLTKRKNYVTYVQQMIKEAEARVRVEVIGEIFNYIHKNAVSIPHVTDCLLINEKDLLADIKQALDKRKQEWEDLKKDIE